MYSLRRTMLALSVGLLFLPATSHAAVRMPSVFGSHMVLRAANGSSRLGVG